MMGTWAFVVHLLLMGQVQEFRVDQNLTWEDCLDRFNDIEVTGDIVAVQCKVQS